MPANGLCAAECRCQQKMIGALESVKASVSGNVNAAVSVSVSVVVLGGEGVLVMGCCFQRRRINFSSSHHKIKWWLLLKLESDFFWFVDIYNFF